MPSSHLPESASTSGVSEVPHPHRTETCLFFLPGGADYELPDLNTFSPTESKFENKAYAEHAYNDAVGHSVAYGVRDHVRAAAIGSSRSTENGRRAATTVAYTSMQPSSSRTLSTRKVTSYASHMPSH